ncbi:DegV family protein [Hydrogenoanaerobacterium sp.]|uniref:DegV family protein n=1 Tax=Hydrogenoanaerobacterium sp. TaxID=2953763 RepID=UPI00289926A3|nr:DegV family protein [Hydrogenoanaerobacterium sp.]
MKYKLVVDSCCDVTPELRNKLPVEVVPLTMKLGDEAYVDDSTLNLDDFLAKMKVCKTHIRSACPSPGDYAEAYKGADTTFVVTLSSNLSGSHNSAVLGERLASEDVGEVHVFDSKSASAGELLIALQISEFIERKLENSEIVKNIEAFIDEMKTFFVLENLDNLIKNGRMNKIVGRVASVLGIRPILGADEEGNIAFFSQARGADAAIKKLAATIGEHCTNTCDKILVITHCNNSKQANKLKELVSAAYTFKDILIAPTGGLSSMYANEGGIIVAF